MKTKVNHSSTDQKSKEKFEVRIKNLKAYQQKYQREYRQQQKYLTNKTHQKEQPPLRRSNRITAKCSKHVTSSELKTYQRSSNKLNYDDPKELGNALQLILINSPLDFCSSSF